MSGFGESAVFIVLTLGLFVGAFVFEILLIRYQQTECKFTEKAIDCLGKVEKRSEQAVILRREKLTRVMTDKFGTGLRSILQVA